MSTPHRIEELIVDLSFGRETDGDTPVDEEVLRGLVLDRLLPALDQALSLHAEDGVVTQIDSLEIDLGEIPEQELESELPLRLQERVRRALADLLGNAVQSNAGPGVRTISRAAADADLLKRYLTRGRFAGRAEAGSPAPHETALGRLLDGATGELLSFLRQAQMRPIFARRLAQQFPERQLHALLRVLMPVSAADELSKLIARLEQLLSGSEADGAARRSRQRWLWQCVLDLALRDGTASSEPTSIEAGTQLPVPAGLRSAAVQLRSALESGVQHPVVRQLLDRLAFDAPVVPAAQDQPTVAATDHGTLVGTDNAAVVRALAQALLQADIAKFGPSTKWRQLLHARSALWREAMVSIGTDAEAWRRIATAFPVPLLDEMTAMLATEAASALRPMMISPARAGNASGATLWDATQLWVASMMYLLHAKTASFDAGRYTDVLLDRMAGGDRILRRASASAWLTLLSVDGIADGPAGGIARALSARLALPELPGSVGAAERRRDANVTPVDLPDQEPQRRPDPRSVTASAIAHRDSDVIEMPDLPAQQQAARLQQWLSQLRESGHGVDAHRWTVEQLHRLINAIAALDGTSGQSTMLQAIALHAPRASNQQRYFTLVLEQLVRGALLDLEGIVAECNVADKDRRTHSMNQAIVNKAGQVPDVSAKQTVRPSSLKAGIIEALTAGDAALEALHREKALPRHAGQTAGFSDMAAILYQLITAVANEHAGSGSSMLLEAIATHARRSSDAARYLRHVLDDLAHERAVDLELIDARLTSDRLPLSAERNREKPGRTADEIVERVVTALSSANPAGMYPDWQYGRHSQAPTLRRALHQIGASIDVWRKVAAEFPASMLDDLTVLLAPDAVPVLRVMATSEAMFGSAGGAARHGSMTQWARQLWIASFMYLLDLKQDQFVAGNYATALLTAITGSDQAGYRRLMHEWKKVFSAELAGGMQTGAESNPLSADAAQAPAQDFTSGNRAGNSPDPDATIEQPRSELAKALDMPPHQQAAWLQQWLSRVRAGSLDVSPSRLNIEQLQRLINAISVLDGTGRQEMMLQAIALHAPRVRDQQRYFATVLEQLARGALLDLEDIVADCNAVGDDRRVNAMEEKPRGSPSQDRRAGAATLAHPGMNDDELEPKPIDDVAHDAAAIRERVVQALLSADSASLYRDWERLRRAHVQHLLQALHQVGTRIDVWRKVAANFPASLLDEMTALLAPEAASALRPLLAQSASLGSTQQLWVVSVMHLLHAKTGFDAGRYANVLLDQLAGQDQIRRRASAAAWLDAISAQQAMETASDAVAQALSEQLALPSPAESAATVDRGIGAGPASGDALQAMRTAIAEALERGDHAALKSLLHRLPPAGPVAELPGLSDDTIVLHRLVNALVTAAAGGANRGPLLQAIATHALRSADPPRFLLHVLEDLVHERTIDLDEIKRRCTLAEGVAPQSATKRTAEESPIAAGLQPAHHPMPLRHGSWLAQLLAAHPPATRAALLPTLHEAGTAASADQIPRTLLRRMVALFASADESVMLRHASDVADIFAQCHPDAGRDRIEELKWQFLFSWLFEQRRHFDRSRFSHALVEYLTGRTGVTSTAAVTELLRRRLGIEAPAQDESPALMDAATTYLMPEAPVEEMEEIYVGNAGQVLAAPYMPRLFSMLNLTEGGRFKSDEAAERAVHLLQFMVSGQTDCPEYQLGLNKILCGVKAGQPIVREIDIEPHEKEVAEALIKAMIEHWKVIGNTSVDGLRESFLQRPGSLHLKDDAWYLTVQAASFDMLLDRLPWSFSIIKHPWMERAVHVNWR